MDEVLHAGAEQLVRLVAEDRPRGGRDVQAATVGIETRDEVGRVLREEPEARFTRAKVVLHALAVGDVAYEGAREPAPLGLRDRDADLHLEQATVAMARLDLDALTERLALSRRQETPQSLVVPLRYELPRKLAADRLFARPAEHRRRALVPVGDAAGLVERPDSIERRVDDPAPAGLRPQPPPLVRAAGAQSPDPVGGGRPPRGREGVGPPAAPPG